MKQMCKTVRMEWTRNNGVGSRETLFKKYPVDCGEAKCIIIVIYMLITQVSQANPIKVA